MEYLVLAIGTYTDWKKIVKRIADSYGQMYHVLIVEFFFSQGSSKPKCVPSMMLTQTSCQTKEMTQANICSASHKSLRDNKKNCQTWNHTNIQPTYQKGQSLRGLKSEAGLLLDLPKARFPTIQHL